MENNVSVTNDNGAILWGVLGCCIPVAGLVLFLVWKDSKPQYIKTKQSRKSFILLGFVAICFITHKEKFKKPLNRYYSQPVQSPR